ncbi:MAG: hypothetical protein RLZZ118_2126, partial [Bacteroidota bacterium]
MKLALNFLKSIILVLLPAILLLFNSIVIAQNALFTTVGSGGKEFGAVIGIKPDSINLMQSKVFDGLPGGNPLYSTMVLHTNGKMYGTQSIGGKFNLGVIYEYNPATNGYTVLYDFDGGTNGGSPQGGLFIAVNGKMYGTTRYGGSASGSSGFGVIFEFNPFLNQYLKKANLSASVGYNPLGCINQAPNGKYYLLCGSGGQSYTVGSISTQSLGEIIEIDSSTFAISRKVAFASNPALGTASVGRSPASGLLFYNGKFYASTQYGGLNGVGILFEYVPGTTTATKIYDFITANGANPQGTLSMVNGKLFGTTNLGGVNSQGVIFQFDIANNTYTKKADFSSTIGAQPSGQLILASNNKFYGFALFGGANNFGTLYEFNYLSNTLTKKIDCNTTIGGKPYGGLVQNTDGKLYGTPNNGSFSDGGTLISFDTSSNAAVKLIDFQSAINGANPQSSLTKTTSGRIFGLTKNGGVNGAGTLFEYFPTSNTITKLIDFSSTNGKNPIGAMIEAPNGKLYGTTDKGGTSDLGTIFEFNPTGNVFTKKIDNTSNTPELNSFVYSTGSKLLTISATATYTVNLQQNGAIVEYDYNTNALTTKYIFLGNTGADPKSTLFKANNGKLYGVTSGGGDSSVGVIYEYDHTADVYTKKIDLSQPIGKIGFASLVEGNTNTLLGVTSEGGLNNSGEPSNYDGTIFEYDFVANTYSVKYNFSAANGFAPKGPLFKASDGKYYGLTTKGGANGKGVIYQYNLATNTYTKKFDLVASSGTSPAFSGFIEAAVGACTNPTQPTVASSANNVCPGTTLTLTASGTLNDATQWSWYTSSCGGTLIGTGTTFTVAPTVTTTYYVKGTGGCTSGASCGTITITVKPKATSTLSITSCNPYTWTNGVTYSVSGTYTQTITGGGSNGCDSIATLVYVKKNATNSVTNINSCVPYTWTNGTTYSVTATANQTLVNAAGCDSISTLNFTRKLPSNSTTNITSCNSFTWVNGTTYTTSTVATYTLTNAAGCDSVLTLNFTRKLPSSSVTNISSCLPYTWTNGTTYS